MNCRNHRNCFVSACPTLPISNLNFIMKTFTSIASYFYFYFYFYFHFVSLRLKDNTLEIVKIADFGLSQFYRPGVHLKCDGSGTISTSAPELFVKNATYKSETYNLGRIMIWMTCMVYCIFLPSCNINPLLTSNLFYAFLTRSTT